ncbi:MULTISPECIES: chemotaxis protein CheW [Cyanophyceae]|uniref:Chemotaxis protein CheW n=1 Tax=Stenomitos frigidus AS-A4 TaxID=2933935 RepID=A0ABV0KNE4_9CYAN|nr:chemotaxis protein CheW [Phormidium sp. FACHB-592]
MNHHSVNASMTDIRQAKTTVTAPTLKAIACKIGHLNLAIRIESVDKILKQTPVYSSGLNSVGIAHVGDREVTVFDLERHLFQTSNMDTAQTGYLVVVRNTANEFRGIPVALLPTLIDIPLPTLRLLPESYRHSDTLGIASHVALIPEPEGLLTLFLLDLNLDLPLVKIA